MQKLSEDTYRVLGTSLNITKDYYPYRMIIFNKSETYRFKFLLKHTTKCIKEITVKKDGSHLENRCLSQDTLLFITGLVL